MRLKFRQNGIDVVIAVTNVHYYKHVKICDIRTTLRKGWLQLSFFTYKLHLYYRFHISKIK
jgi:hypothetical protein